MAASVACLIRPQMSNSQEAFSSPSNGAEGHGLGGHAGRRRHGSFATAVKLVADLRQAFGVDDLHLRAGLLDSGDSDLQIVVAGQRILDQCCSALSWKTPHQGRSAKETASVMAIWERKLVGTATSGFLYSGPMLQPAKQQEPSKTVRRVSSRCF